MQLWKDNLGRKRPIKLTLLWYKLSRRLDQKRIEGGVMHYLIEADCVESSCEAMGDCDADSVGEAIEKAKKYAENQCGARNGEIIRWKLSELGEEEECGHEDLRGDGTIRGLPITASGAFIYGSGKEVNVNFDNNKLGPTLTEAHKVLAALQEILPKSRLRRFVRMTMNDIDLLTDILNCFDDYFFVSPDSRDRSSIG